MFTPYDANRLIEKTLRDARRSEERIGNWTSAVQEMERCNKKIEQMDR